MANYKCPSMREPYKGGGGERQRESSVREGGGVKNVTPTTGLRSPLIPNVVFTNMNFLAVIWRKCFLEINKNVNINKGKKNGCLAKVNVLGILLKCNISFVSTFCLMI